MGKFIDLTGRTYGWLTVVERAENDEYGNVRWLCLCKCGKYKIVRGSALKTGLTRSCGCYHKERVTKHGGSNDPLYPTHRGMLDRCYNPKDERYPTYGALGVKVCPEWHDCTNFFKWAYANGYEPGLTIERIDVHGDYCPENCCWIPKEDQAFNKTTSIICTVNAKTQALKQHVEDPEINVHRLKYHTVWDRFRKHGWTLEEAFSIPLGGNRTSHEVL